MVLQASNVHKSYGKLHILKGVNLSIDRDEYVEPDPNAAGDPRDALPVVGKKWGEAQAICQARGARLCKESEWEFACEGPESSPYPHGWKRESGTCSSARASAVAAPSVMSAVL